MTNTIQPYYLFKEIDKEKKCNYIILSENVRINNPTFEDFKANLIHEISNHFKDEDKNLYGEVSFNFGKPYDTRIVDYLRDDNWVSYKKVSYKKFKSEDLTKKEKKIISESLDKLVYRLSPGGGPDDGE